MEPGDWYIIDNIESLSTPALVVYPPRISSNIDLALKIQPDVNYLRPHVKTNKIPEVQQMLMDAGIRKFKCATIAEAEMLAQIEAPDVLLAYQPVGPNIERFLSLVIKYPSTQFSCLVDNSLTAKNLDQAFASRSLISRVWIDVNVGMDRTGIPLSGVRELLSFCSSLKSVQVIGFHVYDGHITDPEPVVRKRRAAEAIEGIQELRKELEDPGTRYDLCAGGSPTFPVHATGNRVECSPGTFVFWDAGYGSKYDDMPFHVAAILVGRVISRVSKHLLCLDLGYKSMASEQPLPRIKFLNNPDAVSVSQSEEHLVVQVDDAFQHQVGETWYGVPVHICPTVALFDSVSVVHNREITGQWKVTARTRRIEC